MHETEDERGIKRIFAELADKRILAKANHECCQGCAGASLAGEIDGDDRFDGYAFYHAQDDESLRGGGSGLYIGFSHLSGIELHTEAVGQRVVQALRDGGFTVAWNGSAASRILVTEIHFEDFDRCGTCDFREDECECCICCGEYPCECCPECGETADCCRCDEQCEECGELPEDCTCDEDDDDDDDDDDF